jgi:hypothetical protein
MANGLPQKFVPMGKKQYTVIGTAAHEFGKNNALACSRCHYHHRGLDAIQFTQGSYNGLFLIGAQNIWTIIRGGRGWRGRGVFHRLLPHGQLRGHGYSKSSPRNWISVRHCGRFPGVDTHTPESSPSANSAFSIPSIFSSLM